MLKVLIVIFIVILIIVLTKIISIYKKMKNKYLIINKKISAGIAFKWEFEIEDKTKVEFIENRVLKNKAKKNLCGGPIYTDYIFRGLSQGETKIIFRFKSITNEHPDSVEEYIVRVDEHNNIYLVKEIND